MKRISKPNKSNELNYANSAPTQPGTNREYPLEYGADLRPRANRPRLSRNVPWRFIALRFVRYAGAPVCVIAFRVSRSRSPTKNIDEERRLGVSHTSSDARCQLVSTWGEICLIIVLAHFFWRRLSRGFNDEAFIKRLIAPQPPPAQQSQPRSCRGHSPKRHPARGDGPVSVLPAAARPGTLVHGLEKVARR